MLTLRNFIKSISSTNSLWAKPTCLPYLVSFFIVLLKLVYVFKCNFIVYVLNWHSLVTYFAPKCRITQMRLLLFLNKLFDIIQNKIYCGKLPPLFITFAFIINIQLVFYLWFRLTTYCFWVYVLSLKPKPSSKVVFWSVNGKVFF